MGYDTFSPLAPARVNVLCLPAGRITGTSFSSFLQRLQNCSIVALKSVASGSGDQFTPGRCPSGIVLLDFSSTATSSDVSDVVPFQPNAEPQVVLGLVNGSVVSSSESIDLIENLRSRKSSASSIITSCLVVFSNSAASTEQEDILHVDLSNEVASVHNALARLVERVLETSRQSAYKWEQEDIRSPRSARKDTTRRFTSMIDQPGRPGTPSSYSRHTPFEHGPGRVETPSQSMTSTAPVLATRSKGRYQVLLGNLNLGCGLWPDALRHLSEGATIARANSDLVWHAKALESMIICMVLCAWAGVEFNVPQICFASSNRIQGVSPYESQPSGIAVGSFTSNLKNLEPVQLLSQLISPLVNTIFSLHSNAATIVGDLLPEVMICETRIRLLNLLSTVQGGKGLLDRNILDHLIASRSRTADTASVQWDPQFGDRSDFASAFADAIIQHEYRLSAPDRIRVLVAVCSSLARLGSDRKRGFYMRDLLQKLLPALIEARKVGAAEAGIHPSAGITVSLPGVSTNDQTNQGGIRELLNAAAGVFGLSTVDELEDEQPEIEQVGQRLSQWWHDRTEGYLALKVDMLRVCIGIAEALPDLSAELYFRHRLLKVSQPSVRVAATEPEAPSIPSEEQACHVSAIRRTVAAGTKFGIPDLKAQYWDDFLIQDIRPAEFENESNLLPHTAKDLSVTTDEKARDPLIFNPFARVKDSAATPLLVGNELASFVVTLQNPLEAEVEIESISLITKEDVFNGSSHNILLGPLSTQTFVLTGTPTSSGDLTITGCKAVVRDCQEQNFLIFKDDWRSPQTIKQRSSKARQPLTQITPPKPYELLVKVIDPQPLLSITSLTLSRSSVMLLEGESQTFAITLRNESDIPANLLLFTFEDSVTRRLQEALSNKELTPVEVHEIQYQLAARPAIRVAGQESQDNNIEGGQEKAFTFELYGKAGLMEAIILIDFAYLSQPRSEIKATFYTRQIKYPINLTVNGTFDIARSNVLPVGSDFTSKIQTRQHRTGGESMQDLKSEQQSNGVLQDVLSAFSNINADESNGYCIILLDVLNLCPHPLSLTFEIQSSQNSTTNPHTTTSTIQPGHTTRLPILIPRLFISSPFSPIPYLGPTQRQFVVTKSTLPIEAETAQRELFWYREALLNLITATWSTLPDPNSNSTRIRTGTLDLRKAIRLSSRMIDSLRVDAVGITFFLTPTTTTTANPNGSSPPTTNNVQVQTDTFLTLSTHITNRTSHPQLLLLRIQPSLRNQPHPIALDLSKRLMISGTTQRAIHPALAPGETREIKTGILVLVAGDYAVAGSVEELRLRKKVTTDSKVKEVGVGVGVGDGEGTGERRIWYAREPLCFDAVQHPDFDVFHDGTV